jgi:hypothetical protein
MTAGVTKELRNWAIIAGLSVFPLTAILHHVVFFRPTCILNPFKATDYTLYYIGVWLANDPSFLLAGVAAVLVYVVGTTRPLVRTAAIAFLIAFIPATLWLWDIPGTGRWVCYNFHDGRTGIHTRHLYALGAVFWGFLMALQRERAHTRTSRYVATS